MGTYNGGRIVRIKLINFLTYKSLELFPTAGLNLIIGPNGSGKSSVVCSICLGLAGKAAFTGRAIRVSDYIKHGCESAIVEIELHDPARGRNITIRREIKQNCTSCYMLNGKIVKENMIEKEIARFNIQLNNLCQFLPQERVAEFSRMNPRQLLESMQQAVGDQDMYENHMELIKLRAESRKIENEINSRENYLEKEKQQNKILESDVHIYEQRQEYIKKMDLLKEKKPWLMYDVALKDAHTQKKKKESLRAEVRQHANELYPLENKLQKYEQELLDYVTKIDALNGNACRYITHADKLLAKIPVEDDKIQDAKIDLKEKIEMQNDDQKRLLEVEKQLEAFELEYEVSKQKKEQNQSQLEGIAASTNEAQHQLADVYTLQKNVKLKLRSLEYKRQEIQHELQKLSDKEHKKLEFLRNRDRDTYEAVIWLKEHKDIFKKPVYNPILTLIDVHNEQDIKFIENHISFRDLIAFVCVDKEDSKLLVKHLRQGKKLSINTVIAPDKALMTYNPKYSVEELRQLFRFTCYIKDLFTAPEPVMCYLCAIYNIHATPVGNQDTEAFIADKLNNLPFTRFYTPEHSYNIRKSRYGPRNTSTTTTPLQFRGMLSSCGNITEQQKNLEAKLKGIESNIIDEKRNEDLLAEKEQNLARRLEQLRSFRKEYSKQQEDLRMQATRIRQKKTFIQTLKESKINVDEEKKKTALKISKANTEKFAILKELQGILVSHLSVTLDKVDACFSNSCILKKKQSIEENYRKEFKNHSILEDNFNEAKLEHDKLKNEARNFLKQAERMSNITSSNNAALELVIKKLQGLPDKIELLDEEINKIKAKIDCIYHIDKEIIEEHSRRKCDIDNAEKYITSLRSRLAEINEEMNFKKVEWLTPLENLINKISATFSKYFESLGCAGEIILDKSQNPDDFDKYGLSIQIKFRDSDPMIELSQAHHSGGECSVATILFILSLQELTEVPFRCVDEINQGMDSLNERRIFELVVSSAEKSSQYFLLTPKLLSGLTYSPKMKIHIIHNGPSLTYQQWNIPKIIEQHQEFCKSRDGYQESDS